jgi:hypothetical protein
MNNCDNIRDLLVLHAEELLPEGQRIEVETHLASCARCREELSSIGRIRTWLADPELFAPPEDYSWELLPRRLAEKAQAASSPAGRRFSDWLGSRGWALGLIAALILASGLVWLLRRQEPETAAPVARTEAPGNEAFLRRIQSEHARAMTAQYLSECQNLLLNVVGAERSCQDDKYDVSIEVSQARDLLLRKRLLDPELRTPEVARAKDLCDELENLLLGLSTTEKCASPTNLHGLEHFIQKEQLLLRINVLQAELS